MFLDSRNRLLFHPILEQELKEKSLPSVVTVSRVVMSLVFFARGPRISVNGVNRRIPSMETDPTVVLSEYKAARSGGTHRDPSVSVPVATGENPAETATT